MLKIGEVAKKTGVSERSLRHYEKIGLLTPSARSQADYRLYSTPDIDRLQQIVLLKQLGFSLKAIKRLFEEDEVHLESMLGAQVMLLEEELLKHKSLIEQVKHMQALVSIREQYSIEVICKTIKAVNILEKYYKKESLSTIKSRYLKNAGKDQAEYGRAWDTVFLGLNELRGAGVAPDSPKTKPYVLQAKKLINQFIDNDSDIKQALEEIYQKEGGIELLESHGMDEIEEALYDYYEEAFATHGGDKEA